VLWIFLNTEKSNGFGRVRTRERGIVYVIPRFKRDGTRAEIRFGLSGKRTSPFKSAGESIQSSTGSRGVRIKGQQVVMLDRPCSEVQWKSTAYPLHSPVSPLTSPPVRHRVLSGLKGCLPATQGMSLKTTGSIS
jgi:hypothetical protein